MRHRIVLAALASATAATGLLGAGQGHTAAPEARGEYLATIMDCAGCHTGGALTGQPDPARHLAGSEVGFELPGLGIFYPPNLTSDPETGLGTWSEDDIITAIRTGVRPDGRELAPMMPWRSYQHLSDDDARALAAYIRRLPPVRFEAPGPFGPTEAARAPYLTLKMPQERSGASE